MKRFVYADNAATTKIDPEVLEAMLPYLSEQYGNPSSIYSLARQAETAILESRQKVAEALGAEPAEIFFTSGGTESDNWAIKGIAGHLGKKGKKHLITTAFEHHAVLHTCQALEMEGFDVTYLGVNENGIVKTEDVSKAIRKDTALVTIMYANNEIGTVQPIAEIGRLCRDRGILFHTDAVQAVGSIPVDVKNDCIDLLSLSAHKLKGPKGTGALYVRKGVTLPNYIHGGAQERNRRAGTENVAGIVGLSAAMEKAVAGIPSKTAPITAMRDKLIDNILKIPYTRLNGDRIRRLPGNVNISFEGIEGESLLLMLDLQGICASSGSACTSGSLDPSHVLLAIGLPHEVAHGSLRLSLNETNSMEDVDYILGCIPPIVERLRLMSPLWEQMMSRQSPQ